MEGYIYWIRNKINNKLYIGQTSDWKRRKREHFKLEHNSYLRKAYDEFGIDSFEFKVIQIFWSSSKKALRKQLDAAEARYITYFDTTNREKGYNIDGGVGNFSEEHKRNLSIAGLGRTAWNKGVPRSEETKKKISEGRKGIRKGIPLSEEHKRHLSENNGKRKSISKYTLDGEYIETFSSVVSAVASVGGSDSGFRKAVKPKGEGTYKKYIWKYE